MACLFLVGLTPGPMPAPAGVETWAYALLYALGGWSWAVALTGLALRYLDAPSPARRTLADASYWIYIMHLPVVMILQAYAIRLPGPAALKFAAIVALTMLLLLACYRLFVRRSVARCLPQRQKEGVIVVPRQECRREFGRGAVVVAALGRGPPPPPSQPMIDLLPSL